MDSDEMMVELEDWHRDKFHTDECFPDCHISFALERIAVREKEIAAELETAYARAFDDDEWQPLNQLRQTLAGKE